MFGIRWSGSASRQRFRQPARTSGFDIGTWRVLRRRLLRAGMVNAECGRGIAALGTIVAGPRGDAIVSEISWAKGKNVSDAFRRSWA